MSKKTRNSRRFNNPPSTPQTPAEQQKEISKPVSFVKVDAVNPSNNYSTVLYGSNQQNNKAPLSVPNGFITQIPYRSGINSTIIQNPSPIPLRTYYHMATSEPVCTANMIYWITTIVTRISQYSNPNKEYEAQVRKALNNVGFLKLKRALATSIYMGVVALKMNWGFDEDTGAHIPQSILYIPQESMLLAVTPEGNLDPEIGVMQRYYGTNQTQQQPFAYGSDGSAPLASLGTTMVPERAVAVNLAFVSALPEMWRIVHTFNPLGFNGNHWGYSFMQSAYSAVTDKYNHVQKIQTAASYKSAPIAFIETNTETTVQYGPGQSDYRSLSEDLAINLPKIAESGYCILDGLNAIKITTVDNTADIEKMAHMIDVCNNEIRIAHCVPDFVGANGAYASAKVNADVHKDIANNITHQFIETMQEQFVRPVLHSAFGDDIEDYGGFEVLDNSLDDKILWGKVMEMAQNGGVFNPANLDQVNFFANKLGLPPVDKISTEVLQGMLSPNGISDISEIKETIKQPYSKGLDAHERKFK